MTSRPYRRSSVQREIPVETIVAGTQVSNAILCGLKEGLPINEIGYLASSLRRLRKQGKGIVLRCRETFPYMIPLLSEVDGIISPNTTSAVKGHTAEFCREEGKSLVVADERTWQELEIYEGQDLLVDARGQRIILFPDGQTAQGAISDDNPPGEIAEIARLIKDGRHISVLSTVPEPIRADGKFSYFCRQEQLLMSSGRSPWDLLQLDQRDCERILHALWGNYANKVQPKLAVVFRSLDARSDEYPGSPIPHERNPQLGNHGPSLFESFGHLLEAEVAAITRLKTENPTKKIAYLLPFVRRRKEILVTSAALNRALERASLPQNAVELAVMYETPALPYLTEELCAANVRTVWVGTKDLLMSFLMIDRDNPGPHLQDYLNLLDNKGEPNYAFIDYLRENVSKFLNRGLDVVIYSLANEVPLFAKYLPKEVGFLISKGSIKEALKHLEIR